MRLTTTTGRQSQAMGTGSVGVQRVWLRIELNNSTFVHLLTLPVISPQSQFQWARQESTKPQRKIVALNMPAE